MSHPSTSKSNEPEAYEIGWVPFLGTTIHLDSHPLIPRTETEWWCELAIADIKKKTAPRVLDLFAGSGCVGVAILKHVADARVDFGELETRHLPTIQKNIAANTDPAKARVIQTDVWSNIRDSYDFVLANPPYLARSRIERVAESVLAHEPETALFADDDGYAMIAQTLAGLPAHLSAGGQCWVEHEPEHSAQIVADAESLGLKAVTHNDQYGVERYSVILKP